MKAYQIALIASVVMFAIGILLSVFLNAMFLFFFLPIGFAWSLGRRRGRKTGQQQQWRQQQRESPWSSSSPFCTYCGATLREENLFCPVCGKPVQGRIHNDDLR